MSRRVLFWECKFHKCGSCNFNNLVKHETPWCEIVTKSATKPFKPRTWGGFNGDVSRKYLKDWLDYCRRQDQWRSELFKHNQKMIQEMLRDKTPKNQEIISSVRLFS